MPIYRSPSNRLSEYDYGQAGMYFVTICIDRLIFGMDCEIFGKVVEDDVVLNNLGLFVEQQIKETETVRPYVEIISYIVMHDHIHMVLQIHEHDSCRRDEPLARPGNEARPGIKLQAHSLGSIINHIKGRVTRYAKQQDISFKRQSNYYEHVVRNSEDLEKILHYIETNPIRRTEKQLNILS